MGSDCDAATISELHSGNIYESQVLSTMVTLKKGLQIQKYPYNAPTDGNTDSFNDDLYTSFVKSFTGSNYYKKKLTESHKQRKTGDEFGCDLYIKLPTDDDFFSVEQLLRLSAEKIYPLNSRDAAEFNIAGKRVLIEISESAQHLAHKLYQLERALHLLPRAASNFAANVGALLYC